MVVPDQPCASSTMPPPSICMDSGRLLRALRDAMKLDTDDPTDDEPGITFDEFARKGIIVVAATILVITFWIFTFFPLTDSIVKLTGTVTRDFLAGLRAVTALVGVIAFLGWISSQKSP